MKNAWVARAAVCCLVAACNTNDPTYVPAPQPLETTSDMGGNQVTNAVQLKFRAPTDAEGKALADREKSLGFKVPWVQRDDVALSIQFKITNLSPNPGVAQILVNGANEFTDYDIDMLRAAAVMADPRDADPLVLSLVMGQPTQVPGLGSFSGDVREDDFTEAELDLDALGRWMAVPASVLINRSEVNPIGLEMVPAQEVVPALELLRVTLRASQPMRLEYLVRVRDKGNKLWGSGESLFAPKPVVYVPPPPAAMP